MNERSRLRDEIETEAELTSAFFERLHQCNLDWSPGSNLWTLGELAAHLAVIPLWGLSILRFERHDMATASGWTPPAEIHLETLVTEFGEHISRLLDEVRETDLESVWTFSRGTEILARLPRSSALRHYVLGHLAHHRGQLALYMRTSGAEVPGSYGSSRTEAPKALHRQLQRP